MSARFTETEKWSDPWFQSLPHGSKLLFIYLCDRCNAAGFYEENVREACFHLGIEEAQYKGALKGLERGIKGASGWLWVKNFLRHQKNVDLNPENPAHRGVIRVLKEQVERFSGISEFDEFIGPLKGLLRPIGKGKGISKEEEVQEKKPKGTIEDLKIFVQEIGLPISDGEFLFDKWQGNGWRNDGKPILDWRATTRTWQRMGILPSQKNCNGTKKILTAAEQKAIQAAQDAAQEHAHQSRI